MSTGGSGFATLTYHDGSPKGKRLAYLQCGGRGHTRNHNWFEFYELWNVELWKKLIGGRDPFTVLKQGFADGTLGLAKLVRAPNRELIIRVYDMTTAEITVEPGSGEVDIDGAAMPKTLLMRGPETHPATGWRPLVVKEIVREPAPRGGPLKENLMPHIFIAHGEIAHETTQTLGVFTTKDAAITRCNERPAMMEDGDGRYDRHWVEQWEADGDYLRSFEIFPDKVYEHQ